MTDRDSLEQRLQVAIARARDSLSRAQARYKADFDKSIRKSTSIKADDFVFLDMPEASKAKDKLTHKVAGPFNVLEVAVRTEGIQLGEIVERISLYRVSLAPAPDLVGADTLAAPNDTLARKNRGGQSWQFDKILDHRVNTDGSLPFKIKWSGVWQPT